LYHTNTHISKTISSPFFFTLASCFLDEMGGGGIVDAIIQARKNKAILQSCDFSHPCKCDISGNGTCALAMVNCNILPLSAGDLLLCHTL